MHGIADGLQLFCVSHEGVGHGRVWPMQLKTKNSEEKKLQAVGSNTKAPTNAKRIKCIEAAVGDEETKDLFTTQNG